MDPEVKEAIDKRLAELPSVVRDAISSADVQKELRTVSDKHQLHVDQWGKLENEVMITLLGFQNPEKLARNIQNEIGVSEEIAQSLATDINKIVFEPIRQELERQLQSSQAKPKEVSPEETLRQQVLSGESAPAQSVQQTQPVLPATPPAPMPTEKAVRTPISSSYTSRQPSAERKTIEGDPYRLPPV